MMMARKPTRDDPPINGEDPFTPEERAILREMIRTEAHVAWFWATVRSWAVGVSAIIAGIIAFRSDIKSLIAWFIK